MIGTLMHYTGKGWKRVLYSLPKPVVKHLEQYLFPITWSRATLVCLMTLALLAIYDAIGSYVSTNYHDVLGELVFWGLLLFSVHFLQFRLPRNAQYDKVGSELGIIIGLLVYFY